MVAVIFFILLLLPTNALGADIVVGLQPGPSSGGKTYSCDLLIIGEIAPGDGEVFRERILKAFGAGCTPHALRLFSPGGDLKAAIDIGRQVNTLALYTMAPDAGPRGPERSSWACSLKGGIVGPFDKVTGRGDRNCICASACFFIWAGGVKRLGNVVAIHRPHFEATSFSGLALSEARQRYQGLTRAAQEYLSSLEIPDRLVGRMLSINSREGQFLKEDEVSEIRTRRYYEELLIARCGVSEAEEQKAADAALKGFKGQRTMDHIARRMEVSKVYIECYSGARRSILLQAKDDYLQKFGVMP